MTPSFRVAIPITLTLMLMSTAGSAPAETLVSGPQDGTWTLVNSPYLVTGAVTVSAGHSLTLEAGVTVRIRAGAYIHVLGSLVAQGQPNQAVTFTSEADTTGGSPVPGGYDAVYVGGGAVIDFTHTVMRNGGRSGQANLCTLGGAAASVRWVGGYSTSSANDGIRVSADSIMLISIDVDDNDADGIELSPTTPAVLDQIRMRGNNGCGMRILSSPGTFPGTLLGSTNRLNCIYVTGTLGGSAPDRKWTWDYNDQFPYVVDNVIVNAADTLEVASRVVVKFAQQAYLLCQGVGAHLKTGSFIGGNETYFTSYNDDTRGGDTQGDGNAVPPAPGDWTGVYLSNEATADLYRTVFDYAGAGGQASLVTHSGVAAALVMSECTSRYSANDGIRVNARQSSFHNMQFIANLGDGLEVSAVTPPVFTGTFYAQGNGGYVARLTQNPGSFGAVALGGMNGVNGIYMNGQLGGAESADTWTWQNPGPFSYVVANLTVVGPDTLEVGAGTTVKFEAAGSYLYVNQPGALLRTLGTSGASVNFTSIKDDTRGGDTNNNGNATAPAPGDWTAVYLSLSAAAELSHTRFAYGGSGGSACLWTHAGTAASVVWNGGGADDSANDGARIAPETSSFSNLTFTGNSVDGLEVQPVTPAALNGIQCNSNGGYGIRITQNPGSLPGTLSGSGNGFNGVFLNGTVGGGMSPGTWTWGANPTFPYIVSIVSVTGPDTLEIAAGAVVKFEGAGSYLYDNQPGALVRTLGTEMSPVTFTSIKDDSRGGDTNNNGDANVPAPGDWTAVFVTQSGAADLSHTRFAYGGAGGAANLWTHSGTAASIGWHGGGADYSANDGARVSPQTSSFSNLTFTGNTIDGLEIQPTVPAVLDDIQCFANGAYGIRLNQNPGHLPGNLGGSGNGVNGIYVSNTIGGSEPAGTWTWGASPDFPYILANVSVSGPDTLEIAAGAVIKFEGPGSYLFVNQAGSFLRTLGTPENPVWFTSIKDDTQGGDTNNDGGAGVPAPGDWGQLYLHNLAGASLAHTWARYGGGGGTGNVFNAGAMTTLVWNGGGSLQSANAGITGAFNATLTDLCIANNVGVGLSISPTGPSSAHGCDIFGNQVAGARNGFVNGNSAITIDATNCWWGDASGPFDPSTGPPGHNPGGLGDRVSDYILYAPFAGGPQTNLPPHGFALLSPADGTEFVSVNQVSFTWTATVDPDGTPVTYTLIADDDPGFGSPIINAGGLSDTTHAAGVSTYNVPVYWKVIATDGDGSQRLASPSSRSFTIQSVTGAPEVPGPGKTPAVFALGVPHPNPARGASAIDFSLAEPGRVRLMAFDVEGRRIRVLVDEDRPAGEASITWDGRDDQGQRLAAGIYFLRLTAGAHAEIRRVVLMK